MESNELAEWPINLGKPLFVVVAAMQNRDAKYWAHCKVRGSVYQKGQPWRFVVVIRCYSVLELEVVK